MAYGILWALWVIFRIMVLVTLQLQSGNKSFSFPAEQRHLISVITIKHFPRKLQITKSKWEKFSWIFLRLSKQKFSLLNSLRSFATDFKLLLSKRLTEEKRKPFSHRRFSPASSEEPQTWNALSFNIDIRGMKIYSGEGRRNVFMLV